MDEQEVQELKKAISKLSKEDQEQIAGGVISNKQCAQLQHMLEPPGLAKYGGPMPKFEPIKIDLPKKKPIATDYGGPIPKIPKIDLSKLEKPLEENSDNSAT